MLHLRLLRLQMRGRRYCGIVLTALGGILNVTPTAAPHTIKVGAAVVAGYIGHYWLEPLRSLMVTAEDDRLFIEVTNQQRDEVYLESERDFFGPPLPPKSPLSLTITAGPPTANVASTQLSAANMRRSGLQILPMPSAP